MAAASGGAAQLVWPGSPWRARRWGEATMLQPHQPAPLPSVPAGTSAAPSGAARPHPHTWSSSQTTSTPPPHPAAFPATPGFVPIICIFSSSPHCRPNHKSFSGRALRKSPHASVEPGGLASETPFPKSSGPEGVSGLSSGVPGPPEAEPGS